MASQQAEERIKASKQDESSELHLSYCDLEQLPDSLFELTHLSVLILTGNALKFLPPEIAKLTQLKTLDVSGNCLMELPDELVTLNNLSRLELAANKIEFLPNDIGKLGNLNVLDCYGNAISQLPESISNCHNLSELRLAENDITSLPDNFGRLSSLRILDLTANELQTLPDNFFRLSNLTELYINGNLLNVPFHILTKQSRTPLKLLENIKLHLTKHQEAEDAKREFERQQASNKKADETAQQPSLTTLVSILSNKMNSNEDDDLLIFSYTLNGQLGSTAEIILQLENTLKLKQALIIALGKMSIVPEAKQLSDLICSDQKIDASHLGEIYQTLTSLAEQLDFSQTFNVQELKIADKLLLCRVKTTELMKQFSLCFDTLQEFYAPHLPINLDTQQLFETFFKQTLSKFQASHLSESSLAKACLAILKNNPKC